MKKDNKTKQRLIITLIIILLIILLGIWAQNYNKQDEIVSKPNNEIYEKLDIDKSKLNIFYLNVGQADTTLIMMNEKVMLIDAGNKEDGYYIMKFLKAQGIEQIDYLIETHGDDDHSGGISTIFNNFTINNIYMPYSAIKDSEIKDKEIIKIFTNLEDTYALGDATWQVLSVDNSEEVKKNEDNDTSIVIQLNYQNKKFLFMGDSTSKVENQLIKNNKLEKIDVLKVGHHGSSSSSNQKFLDVVKPTYSIISVNNSEYSKHPSEKTIERLNSINSEIYRTDVDGTIWITSDGINLQIDELDINVNGNNIEAKLIENRKYSLFFIAKYYHLCQLLYKCHLLIANSFYNEFLLE